MTDASKAWSEELVLSWLERRIVACKLDQADADRRGYEARDEYDQAAAQEWVCHSLKLKGCTNNQAVFAQRLKELIGQDEYAVAGVNDDVRFERHVRTYLRKLAKMAKANDGFGNRSRFQ